MSVNKGIERCNFSPTTDTNDQLYKFPPICLQAEKYHSEFYRKQTDLLGLSSETQQATADMRISCFSYSQPLCAEPLQQITDME